MKTMNINGDMTFLCLDQTIFLKDIFSNQIFCDKKQKLEDNLRDWRDIWRELVQENSSDFCCPHRAVTYFWLGISTRKLAVWIFVSSFQAPPRSTP